MSSCNPFESSEMQSPNIRENHRRRPSINDIMASPQIEQRIEEQSK
jgi:hypothetical protein